MRDGLQKAMGWTLFVVGVLLCLWGVIAFVANVMFLNRFGLLSSFDMAATVARIWARPLVVLGAGLLLTATGRWLLSRKAGPSPTNIPSQFD